MVIHLFVSLKFIVVNIAFVHEKKTQRYILVCDYAGCENDIII